MAKRYQVHSSHDLTTPSAPDDLVVDTTVDLAVLLSQRLQKNIRQGRIINLHSVKASLKPTVGGGQDIGVAFTGEVWHCPATKNSAKSWREAFKVWNAQKKLRANAVGSLVRYDDFEVAWNASYTDPQRTSTLFATGMNDTAAESVVIYGTSTSGDDITLEDIFESAQGQPEPSRFPLSNAIVKQSKFFDEFPNPVKTPIGAHLSATAAQQSFDSGATVSQPTSYIQDSSTLCGVVKIQGYMLPENTLGHIQDDMTLQLTYTVSIGPSLATIPSRKNRRMSSYKWTSHNRKSRKWKTYRKRGRQ